MIESPTCNKCGGVRSEWLKLHRRHAGFMVPWVCCCRKPELPEWTCQSVDAIQITLDGVDASACLEQCFSPSALDPRVSLELEELNVDGTYELQRASQVIPSDCGYAGGCRFQSPSGDPGGFVSFNPPFARIWEYPTGTANCDTEHSPTLVSWPRLEVGFNFEDSPQGLRLRDGRVRVMRVDGDLLVEVFRVIFMPCDEQPFFPLSRNNESVCPGTSLVFRIADGGDMTLSPVP